MDRALEAPRKPTAVSTYNKSPSIYGGIINDNINDDDFQQQLKQKKRKKLSFSTPSRRIFTVSADVSSAECDELVADPVVGTCLTIEKDYYRLTCAPVPSNVRPLPVLRKALLLIKERWLQDKDYTYCCNQLKSIRQDLTVQHLRTEFACEVYECHGRIAIEQHDFGEFSQILTPLSALYNDSIFTSLDAHCEFIAYRILLACHHHKWSDLALITLIAAFPPHLQQDLHIQHALAVRSALILNDYRSFFQLFDHAPAMSAYLLDALAQEMRMKALKIMCAAYRPKIDVNWMSGILVMEDVEECAAWLVSMELPVTIAPSSSSAQAQSQDTTDANNTAVVPQQYELDAKEAQSILARYNQHGQRVERQSNGTGEEEEEEEEPPPAFSYKAHAGKHKSKSSSSRGSILQQTADVQYAFSGQPGERSNGTVTATNHSTDNPSEPKHKKHKKHAHNSTSSTNGHTEEHHHHKDKHKHKKKKEQKKHHHHKHS